MEFSLTDNALKTFSRCVTCLARVGNDLSVQASPSQLALHSLNSSRSAYQSINFKPAFFDAYTVSVNLAQFSVHLKDICAVFRTPVTNIDRLTVKLSDPDASKVHWILECSSGMRKTYGIPCNIETDIQHLSFEREKFPSNLVVRPQILNRLLTNFQSSLQEITIIATEPSPLPSDGKAVELRSYLDPTKDNDSSLHTQLWIDPKEEFLQYIHNGDPVDVTFSVKELKAFLSFCEGCEVDIHIHFEKAGEPVLLAPKFGLEDGPDSNFDATLVLATMLTSQLHERTSEVPQESTRIHAQTEKGESHVLQENYKTNASELPSDHTRIWSDLSESATKNTSGIEQRQAQREKVLKDDEQREIQRIDTMQISGAASVARNNFVENNPRHPTEEDRIQEPQGNGQGFSQHYPSNWVESEEEEEDIGGDENEQYVQSTPTYYEEP